ncbi:hypothetical protein RND81_14G044600 [Saponaria officinalis]|uniref:F-box domain-containing protein n=1 Tax=Saponaria officinalis TaxID=3572 RepID=A0AAW1GI86_SAPOF
MEDKEAKKCKNKAAIHELPDEVIIEILSKTTSKDLGRCNCVSKQWRYSFTIGAFERRHSYSSASINIDGMISAIFPPWTLKVNSTSNGFKLLTFEIPSKFNKNENNGSIVEGKLKMLPSNLSKFDHCSNIYHGLVCVFKKVVGPYSDLSTVVYSIRTNDVVVLPTSTNYDDYLSNGMKLQTSCFIGFDTKKKEYKIVRMISYYDFSDRNLGTSYETLVVGSRSWNRIDDAKLPSSLSRGFVSLFGHCCCIDGVIFWIQYYPTHGYSIRSHTVAAFDLSHGEFYVFDLDKVLQESSFDRWHETCYIAAVRGCPTVFALRKKYNGDDEVLVCTFFDLKMTTSVLSRTVTRWNFLPRISVSESRFIIMQLGGRRNEGVRISCKDLEKDMSCEIEAQVLN